ncbi:MAG: hypothetical protein ACPGRW_06385 [Flavobacteriaceae bacterium]
MAVDCPCPLSAALTSITKANCGFDMGQIQRFAVQRLGNSFLGDTDANNITKLSAWTTRLAATDSTKIVVSPLIGGDPIITAGEVITTGGDDNTTLNGEEEVTGVGASLFTCVFKSITPDNEREMQLLLCEKKVRVFLFNHSGKIFALDVTLGGADKQGFEASNLFLSDRTNSGFGTKDTHPFRMSLPSGWSNNLVQITPEFNPLTEI